MRNNGTDLRDVPDELQHNLNLPRGKELYSMVGACGLLDESGLCTSYDQRPETCRTEIDPGDRLCLGIRAERLSASSVALPMPTVRPLELVP